VHAGYVLVHRSLLSPEAAERIEAFLDRQPQLQREATERDVVLFRVSATLPDLGTPV
jgi:hypothetical protein